MPAYTSYVNVPDVQKGRKGLHFVKLGIISADVIDPHIVNPLRVIDNHLSQTLFRFRFINKDKISLATGLVKYSSHQLFSPMRII